MAQSHAAAGPQAQGHAVPDVTRLASPGNVLAPGWQKSEDRSVTTVGDDNGFHVLVADASSGYQWRTAATLSEPGADTSQWIGQSCVTSSGRRAVVVYAPREFTNNGTFFDRGAFVAVVDLVTGAVRKLPFTVSLAYYNPGCGVGEQVALTSQETNAGRTTSVVRVVDAAGGQILRTTTTAGQLSSAVPYAGGVAAVLGDRLVSVGAKGAEHTLTREAGTPFRLHPDADSGLAYEVAAGKRATVRRFAAGKSASLGSGRLDAVQLAAAGGHLFVTGADAARVDLKGKDVQGWRRLDTAPVNSEPSTTGALVVTDSSNHQQQAALRPGSTAPRPDGPPDQIAIKALVTGTGHRVSFTLHPSALNPRAGAVASPALTHFPGAGSGARPAAGPRTRVAGPAAVHPDLDTTGDPSSEPWDPDRGCSIPRNDPAIQTYQPTAAQVEWAADLAVQGQLTRTRAANWEGSGMPVSWSPQGMFPLQALKGGGKVPAQVVLGVLAQESNTMQASPHAVDAVTGNFNQGGFYGDQTDWSTVDCGYGIGQVTTGMAMSTPAGTAVADGNMAYTTAEQQQAIATDYASNIAATVNMLTDKWNQLKDAGIIAGNGDPSYIENWWFTVWAYNSGVEPGSASFGNTTGCTPSASCTDGQGNWGLGWANNPANPSYPADRGVFTNSTADTKVPNHWTYPELVMGWAYSPVPRFDYASGEWGPAYAAANGEGAPQEPDLMAFCTSSDNCVPDAAADSTGTADSAGLCTQSSSHCWWHNSDTWVNCTVSQNECGTQKLSYDAASAIPGGTDIYPADCRALGTSSGSSSSDSTGPVPGTGSIVVDDVTTPSVASCNQTWTDHGSFGLHFNYDSPTGSCTQCIDYPGKIDFHQLGVGFGGHIWMGHTVAASDTGDTVTGTWKPPAITGWYRVAVHIPDSGAATEQADYTINLGDGSSEHRVVNQRWATNTWVPLGDFDVSGQPSVSLSNATRDGNGADIAWDAVAFTPSSAPAASYVAMGDSYSSGEGQDPYDPDSDYNYNDVKDGCHRSVSSAYPREIKLPGQSETIEQEAQDGVDTFADIACSGVVSPGITENAVDATPTTDDINGSTVWGSSHGGYGEVQEADQGYLTAQTSLVTISVGGDDARFAAVLKGCIMTVVDCTQPDFKLTVNGTIDPEPLVQYEPYVIQTLLPSHLKEVYETIHADAPNARIVVVGYPHLFEPNPQVDCGATSPQDQTFFNSMAGDLDTTINTVVNQVKSEGIDIAFADPRSAFDGTGGHWVCDGSGTEWINGLIPTSDTGSSGSTPDLPGTGSFHPTAAGQAAYAQLVDGYVTG
ncbi:GDSL-type esterase/lipase family protein [Streptomyces sp. SL13]|uniref:GDSL-type esterase/lipase family protein n=1 Tax=Streptantibioticus silvisoli TaxID=2705255 RepID=A0AA90H9D3_9ACTN|nr:GDSL-type esterase/lipase family protein [Streptantibioticus silvisoli]MDI5973555.1 GDSL-type esterase/lipase family protein [Streptantibioticus silvisoli]